MTDRLIVATVPSVPGFILYAYSPEELAEKFDAELARYIESVSQTPTREQ
jgi:hypothetical protein